MITKKIDLLEEKSEMLQEVLEKQPNNVVLFGSSLFLVILLAAILLCHFFQYPDVIKAPITLVKPNPPIGIIAKSSGPIQFLTTDDQLVTKGMIVAYIENQADFAEILSLQDSLLIGIELWITDPFKIQYLKSLSKLGSLQFDANKFSRRLEEFQFYNDSTPYLLEIEFLREQLQNYEKQRRIIENKLGINRQQLDLIKSDFKRSSLLHDSEVISTQDFEVKQNELLKSSEFLENLRLEKSRNKIAQTDLNTAIVERTNQYNKTNQKLKADLLTSHKQLLNSIDAWRDKWVLTSPTDGIVSLFKYWQNNQYVRSDTEVMTIIPNSNTDVFGRIVTPVYNSGKIEIGQSVNILLDSYPYQEYGLLNGYVEKISQTQRNNAYMITIRLDESLTTSYEKTLEYKNEMTGMAEIITEDLSLLDRVFYQLRKKVILNSR